MDAVAHAQGLTKRWGQVVALSDVTATIGTGVTGLLGANGAGKTTLIGMILGLHPPDAGTLTVLGADPTTAGPEVRARLGYAPEHDALPPEARAQDLVRHVAELHGLPRQVAVTRASETLDLVGLGEERLREIGTMSQGQRQRVKIAQAIAHDPTLVLLDEPTNGLDPIQRDDMLVTIRRIGHDLGIHVVVSSHLIHEVERICDAVVVLDAGRLRTQGEVAAMIAPGDRFVLEVDGDVEAVAQALGEAELEVGSIGRGRLVVTVPHEDALDGVRDALVATGTGIRRLQRHTATLEEHLFAVDMDPQPAERGGS